MVFSLAFGGFHISTWRFLRNSGFFSVAVFCVETGLKRPKKVQKQTTRKYFLFWVEYFLSFSPFLGARMPRGNFSCFGRGKKHGPVINHIHFLISLAVSWTAKFPPPHFLSPVSTQKTATLKPRSFFKNHQALT